MVLDLHSSEQNFRHGDTQDIIRKAENLSYEVIRWTILLNARNAGGIWYLKLYRQDMLNGHVLAEM